ncbi:MAG: 1-acyl-sn-glycerol-3-phosphate acyltransferase [Balneolaceae bacterium]|nr:1-acyl-sn-glycerol-3-phosphate acyltransferase [Balneolaceae bacterium]
MRKNFLWYELFRHGIVGPALGLFYSRRTISGSEQIPVDKPVIFVPNHQNSFIDALHVVCNTRRFIHFLTRADPFEKPLAGWFLGTLNMEPVYRVRDGFSTVKKNETIFENCYRYLRRNDAILVFAEASHDLRRRIRPISKGFTRIAFGAEERYGWGLDLQILPVGISYGDHRKSRTSVHVEFGGCIALSEYRDLYAENPREAERRLKAVTAERMKELTMHVPDLHHYPLHKLLLDDLEHERGDLLDPETANRRVSVIEANFSEERLKEAKELQRLAEEHRIRLKEFVSPVKPQAKDLALSPLYLFSIVNNIVPYQPVQWMVKYAFEEDIFDASVKFLSGLIFFPLFYLLVSVLMALSGVGYAPLAGYLLLSIATAPFFVRAKDLLKRSPLRKLKRAHPGRYESIKSRIETFIRLRESLFNR